MIAIAYYIGNSIGKKNQDDIQIKKEIKIVINYNSKLNKKLPHLQHIFTVSIIK